MSTQKKSLTPVFEKYSIFQTGGKQYQAIEGQTIAIEKLNVEAGQSVVFKEVLLRKLNDEQVEIGVPYIKATVKAVVIKHMRGPKLIVFKFKRRKKYTRKKGHRQPITVIRVESI